MQIRSLGGVRWEELAAAFNEAFSDYAVPMAMTAESLANMQRRRGHVAELSFGAYDGSRLVGFVLTCLEGDRAYNSGTGVVPSHRRTGVARELLDAVIASVPARTYQLEVLEDNAPAIAFYTSAGFVETRRLLLDLRSAKRDPRRQGRRGGGPPPWKRSCRDRGAGRHRAVVAELAGLAAARPRAVPRAG